MKIYDISQAIFGREARTVKFYLSFIKYTIHSLVDIA